MESDTHFLYFTKRSGKSRDFYFLGVIHLNTFSLKLLANRQTNKRTNDGDYIIFPIMWWIWTTGCVLHYADVIMTKMASQITSLTIVYSTVYSGADQSKHQSSASLAFVWGIHRGPVNWPVTRKMFSFDDVIMEWQLPSTHLEAVVYGTGSACAGNLRRGERRREQTNRLRDH